MVKNKLRFCPNCNQEMKFRGNRIWFCKTCKKSYHYFTDIKYEKDEAGNVKKNFLGKPKIKSRVQKINQWSTSR